MRFICLIIGHKYKMFHKRKFNKTGSGMKSKMVTRYRCTRCGKVQKL